MKKINTPISVGELFDKITILEIKRLKIKDKNKLIHVKNELKLLKNVVSKKKRVVPVHVPVEYDTVLIGCDTVGVLRPILEKIVDFY